MASRHGPYMAGGWSRITTFGGGDFYRLSLEAMWLLVLCVPKEIASYIGTGGGSGGISWDLGGLGGYKLRGSTSIADWDFPTMNESMYLYYLKSGWVFPLLCLSLPRGYSFSTPPKNWKDTCTMQSTDMIPFPTLTWVFFVCLSGFWVEVAAKKTNTSFIEEPKKNRMGYINIIGLQGISVHRWAPF